MFTQRELVDEIEVNASSWGGSCICHEESQGYPHRLWQSGPEKASGGKRKERPVQLGKERMKCIQTDPCLRNAPRVKTFAA